MTVDSREIFTMRGYVVREKVLWLEYTKLPVTVSIYKNPAVWGKKCNLFDLEKWLQKS